METPIYLVSLADNNYAQHLGVMLCSLFRNKRLSTDIRVYILDGGISKKNKERLSRLSSKFRFSLVYLAVNQDIYKDFRTVGNFNRATYYRLSMPDLLDKRINQALYIDCDAVIRKDLSELWHTDISRHYLAAVKDWAINKVGYSRPDCYFNSGVMLLNLEKIRKDDIMSRAISYIKDHPNIELMDQDALNAIIKDDYIELPATYNVTTFTIPGSGAKSPYPGPYESNAVNDPHIVHFAGIDKPWMFCNDYPHKKIYYEYLRQTPWRFYVPKDIRYGNIKYYYLNRHPFLFSLLKKIKSYLRGKITP